MYVRGCAANAEEGKNFPAPPIPLRPSKSVYGGLWASQTAVRALDSAVAATPFACASLNLVSSVGGEGGCGVTEAVGGVFWVAFRAYERYAAKYVCVCGCICVGDI